MAPISPSTTLVPYSNIPAPTASKSVVVVLFEAQDNDQAFYKTIQNLKEQIGEQAEKISEAFLNAVAENPNETDFAIKTLAAMSAIGITTGLATKNTKKLTLGAVTGLSAAGLFQVAQSRGVDVFKERELLKPAINSAFEYAKNCYQSIDFSELYKNTDSILPKVLSEMNARPLAANATMVGSAFLSGVFFEKAVGEKENRLRNLALATLSAGVTVALFEGLHLLKQ